jgi:Holliday junction resolvase RusA-like endonuclease
MNSVEFTVYARPEPQGSSRAFMFKGRPIITSANKKLKPYRQELTNTAQVAVAGVQPFAAKHVPVFLQIRFYLEKPKSVPKKRFEMVVLPDLDKLVRATADALKGICYADDAQVVWVNARKVYGTPERVEIKVQIIDQLFG